MHLSNLGMLVCKFSLCICKGKPSLLSKTEHVMSLPAIQNVLLLFHILLSPWLMI